MPDDFARKHIATIAAAARRDRPAAIRRLQAACWPGGSADRIEPVAREWLSHWHPARAAAVLPTCLCQTGRCPVCN